MSHVDCLSIIQYGLIASGHSFPCRDANHYDLGEIITIFVPPLLSHIKVLKSNFPVVILATAVVFQSLPTSPRRFTAHSFMTAREMISRFPK